MPIWTLGSHWGPGLQMQGAIFPVVKCEPSPAVYRAPMTQQGSRTTHLIQVPSRCIPTYPQFSPFFFLEQCGNVRLPPILPFFFLRTMRKCEAKDTSNWQFECIYLCTTCDDKSLRILSTMLTALTKILVTHYALTFCKADYLYIHTIYA